MSALINLSRLSTINDFDRVTISPDVEYNETTTNSTNDNNTSTAIVSGFNQFYTGAAQGNYSAFEIFRIIFLSASLVTSMAGNACVLWASGRQLIKRKYTRLHVLLVSLALSDMLQGPCQIMPQLVETIAQSWDLDDAICRIHTMTRSMLTNISITTLAVITVERYLNLESVDGNANTSLYAYTVIGVWVFQAALSARMAVWTKVISLGNVCVCRIPYTDLHDTLNYTIAARTVAFFCPLLVLWIGNLGVIYKLRRMNKRIKPFDSGVNTSNQRKRRNRKVTITCLMLATAFTVNLTPFQAALLVVQTGTSDQVAVALDAMVYLWYFTVFNCCLNPFIYGFALQDFKKWWTEMMCKCVKRSDIRKITTTGSHTTPSASNNAVDTNTPEHPASLRYPPVSNLLVRNVTARVT